MHTKTEQYKGFNIDIVSYDGLGTVNFTFFVKGAQFKAEGYATLNAAKGAITKAIKASPFYGNEGEETEHAMPATSVALPVEAPKSRVQREGRYSGQVNGKPARYYVGMGGKVCDSFATPFHFPNRKARKAAMIEASNKSRPQFGGRITK